MTMTYTWEVIGLKKASDGTVVQTYWKKTGTDSDGNIGSFSGATPFERNDEAADFIPFESLTEEVVLGWIQGVVVDDYEEHVNGVILKQINELTVTEADLPWAEAPEG